VTAVDYDYCMGLVLQHEGGYSNDVGDPGGPTNFGITLADYSEYMHMRMTAAQVRAMPKSDAMRIYQRKYAMGVAFDQLPAGIDYTMLDYGVNSGVSRPMRVASALCGLPTSPIVRGVLLQAINKQDSKWFVESMNAERLHFMHGIRGGTAWQQFGHGWGRRVDDVQRVSLSLIKGGPSVVPQLGQAGGKAQHAPDPQARKKILVGAGTGSAASAASHAAVPAWVAMAGVVMVVIAGVAVWISYHQGLKAAQAKVVLPPGVTPRPV
jgi:lysozyme family protein